MARRPRVFDQAAFEEAIRALGRSEKEAKSAANLFKLAAPMALKELGAEMLAEVIIREEGTYGLKPTGMKIPAMAKMLVQWAEGVLAQYHMERAAKTAAGKQDEDEPDEEEPEAFINNPS